MSKQRRKNGPVEQRHQLRIIGGCWRGRRLDIADVEGLRPTSDRIRETLFNWLAPEIAAAHCLDLFAGSGALGLEALSRGAEQVVMVERDPVAFEMLESNCGKLGASGIQIVHSDALLWLDSQVVNYCFDLVFLDPPFGDNFLQPCLNLLSASASIRTGGLIYVETPANAPVPFAGQNAQLYREKLAGNVAYRLYRRI